MSITASAYARPAQDVQIGVPSGGGSIQSGGRDWSVDLPAEVRVSQTVKDLVAGSGLIFENAGDHELKGLPDRWHLYRVVK
jgi:hypothetical protein